VPESPDPIPEDINVLMELMDDASKYAQGAQGMGAPLFDHSIRIFTQLNAHYQIKITRELQKAHNGLITATNALRVATWWLAIVTVLLGECRDNKKIRHSPNNGIPLWNNHPYRFGDNMDFHRRRTDRVAVCLNR